MGDSDIPKIEKLNKSNYALWKFNMSNFLAGKTWNKLTDGTVNLENNPAQFPQADAKAMTAIGFSLDQEHLAMVVHCRTSKEMWDAIVATKERHSETNRMLAQCEWHNYKFKPGISCSEYLGGLNLLKVKIAGLSRQLEEMDVISKVLHDLPREFDNFRENWRILATENEELMTLDKFSGHLLASELSFNNRRKADAGESSGEAFVSHDSQHRKGKKDKKNVECFNCGKKGHFKSECWSLESSDDDRKDSYSRRGRQNQGKRNNTGFLARNKRGISGEWIADSGASFHMTGDQKNFTSYKALQRPKQIYIANGGLLEAVGVGTITCEAHDGDSWYETEMRDVHLVPDLGSTNLFSLRSTAKKGFVITHDDKRLRVEDKTTRDVMLVGDCSRSDGMFVLRLEMKRAEAALAKSFMRPEDSEQSKLQSMSLPATQAEEANEMESGTPLRHETDETKLCSQDVTIKRVIRKSQTRKQVLLPNSNSNKQMKLEKQPDVKSTARARARQLGKMNDEHSQRESSTKDKLQAESKDRLQHQRKQTDSLPKKNLIMLQELKADRIDMQQVTVSDELTHVEVKTKSNLEANGRRASSLMMSSINLLGGELRRKTEEDERMMLSLFVERDLIYVEKGCLEADVSLSLHTRSHKDEVTLEGVGAAQDEQNQNNNKEQGNGGGDGRDLSPSETDASAIFSKAEFPTSLQVACFISSERFDSQLVVKLDANQQESDKRCRWVELQDTPKVMM